MTTQNGCRRCADLDNILETLTEIIRRLRDDQPAHNQPPCGHRYARLGGTLTTCVAVGEHLVHDNGRGVHWAREGT